jgi:hypothetical protein
LGSGSSSQPASHLARQGFAMLQRSIARKAGKIEAMTLASRDQAVRIP